MMKRMLFVVVCALFVSACAGKMQKPLIQNDFQLMKAEQDAQFLKVQGENSALRLQAKELEAKLNAQAAVVAGIANKTENASAGRDIIKNNDSELLKFIFEKWYLVIAGLFGFVLSILTGVWGIVKFVMSMNERVIRGKDEELSRLLRSTADKEAKLDKWQTDLIVKLIQKTEVQK